jgi:hypothetical protein
MSSIIQIIEQNVEAAEVFLPVVEGGLAAVLASLPSVYNTPPVSVRIGGHVYSASLVLNKVS